MEDDRALPDPMHRSPSLWQSDYHLGCDLTAGWKTPGQLQQDSGSESGSLSVWKSESEAAMTA